MSLPDANPSESELRLFGIRHHGPGCARCLEQELAAFHPDILLVEGPPDANDILSLAAHAEMQPPVALLLYQLDKPQNAVYYPFAEFSPEWRAILYGLRNHLPVQFIDLPQCHQLAMEQAEMENQSEEHPQITETAHIGSPMQADQAAEDIDPFSLLAKAAGYTDVECWWDQQIERTHENTGIFPAIQELMCELRGSDTRIPSLREQRREAHMRQCIRQTRKTGFLRIAVVAGAWHIPNLMRLPSAKQDQELLKNMPKVKTVVTWTPWTYNRLTQASGYGAGVLSPGYYEHIWRTTPTRMSSAAWMIKVARLLRGADLEGSPASSIEAARLADALAAIRGCSAPGLNEFSDAALSVFCQGNALPLRLIYDKLIVGENLGKAPDETPLIPLQWDLRKEQKRLRLPPEASDRFLELDLRKPYDLERSHLLRRLNLLGIPWAKSQDSGGKGTFHENWILRWEPEFEVRLIEAGIWGASLEDAASTLSIHSAHKAADLAAVTALTEQALLSDLPQAATELMNLLQSLAATSGDTGKLMDAAPPLIRVLRYGNVRQTDSQAVAGVVKGLLSRIYVGLPAACNSLNDEAAEEMLQRLNQMDASLRVLQDESYLSGWTSSLQGLVDTLGSHGLIQGRSTRLLLEHQRMEPDEAGKHLSQTLSQGNPPAQAATWIDGFLRGSGLLLIHTPQLWKIIDIWVSQISTEHFQNLLPVLRRTFSSFPTPERKQMAILASQHGGLHATAAHTDACDSINIERANQALPLLMAVFGVATNEHT